MTLLTTQVKKDIAAYLQRSGNHSAGVKKSDILNAIDETDQWIEDNQTNYLAFLNSSFRSSSNSNQILALFAYTLLARAGLQNLVKKL